MASSSGGGPLALASPGGAGLGKERRQMELFMEETSLILSESLSLRGLPKHWTRDCWESQFTECHAPPSEYRQGVLAREDGGRAAEDLEAVADLALKWREANERRPEEEAAGHNDSAASGSGSDDAGYWSALVRRGIKYKKLIALLFYLLDRGQRLEAKSFEREQCCRAAGLYFVLLSLPGSGAFSIFHPVLFNRALDTFKLATKLRLAKFSPKKKRRGKKVGAGSTASSSQQQKAPRMRHASRAGSTCSSAMFDDDGSDDSDPEMDPSLLPASEIQALTNSLNRVLYHFLHMLEHCSLKRSAESLEVTVQELVELTRLETEFASLDFGRTQRQRRSGLSAMAFNAYIGLEKVCRALHGDVRARLVPLVFKHLLPAVLMTHRGASEVAPRGLTIIREHTLHFVKHLMTVMGEDTHDAAEVLIQHLALQVPERAEYRHKASSAVVEVMRGLPGPAFRRAVRWLFCWAHNEKVAHRQFAVEVMGELLQEDEREAGEAGEGASVATSGTGTREGSPVPSNSSEVPAAEAGEKATEEEAECPVESATAPAAVATDDDLVSHKFIFGVVFSRCRDVSATVRACALQTLAKITEANHSTMAVVIRNILGPEEGAAGGRTPKGGPVDFVDLLSDPSADLASVNPLPSTESFLDFLRKRALDDSVYVRKNALQVLDNIVRSGIMSKELVAILMAHCRDSSLMVRKLMVSSLSGLVRRNPDSDMIVKHWVEGVFPLFLDVEQKASERAHQEVWELLFTNIVPFGNARTEEHLLPWRILHHAKVLKLTKYLSRACGTWAKDGLLKPSVLSVLKTHVGTENNEHAWLVLSLVTVHLPLQDPHFVMSYFKDTVHSPEGVGLYTLLQVLRVLFASVARLAAEERLLLQSDLVLLVRRFALPADLVSCAVDIATVVSELQTRDEHQRGTDAFARAYQSRLDAWATEVIEMIDDELTSKILNPAGGEVENLRMMRQIFTLGELAQICPHKINKRLFLLMQSIIFQEGTKHRKHSGRVPSSQTQSSQPPPCSFTPTTRLQAVSIVTLAKMCLQHEDMAKKIVPAFGRLLLDSSSATTVADSVAIKNNVMCALTDMCKRYANLVDPLIPQMAACLKDPSITVRTTTLITLIYLLQEDYLKMSGRGAFFFRILQTLNDESEEMRSLVTFYFQQRLLKRKPKTMYSHFVEALFHFNEYEDHQRFNKFVVTEREKELFSIKGPEHRGERMVLYKFMLRHMEDADRLGTMHKISEDVLKGVVNGQVSLDDKSFGLLQDSLSCLASEEIKLSTLNANKADEDDEAGAAADGKLLEEEMRNQAVIRAVHKSIVTQAVKKSMVEHIIPNIIDFKHALEVARSPLLSDLMTSLRELMKDFKNEAKDLLASDRQLATEIEYDLKKWEEEQKKAEEETRRESSTAGGTPRDAENEQLIRDFIEGAAQAIREKMRQREERRRTASTTTAANREDGGGGGEEVEMAAVAGDGPEAAGGVAVAAEAEEAGGGGGGDATPAAVAEEDDPEARDPTSLQAFVTSNHVLEGDRIPDRLPQILSRGMVVDVEDISPRLNRSKRLSLSGSSAGGGKRRRRTSSGEGGSAASGSVPESATSGEEEGEPKAKKRLAMPGVEVGEEKEELGEPVPEKEKEDEVQKEAAPNNDGEAEKEAQDKEEEDDQMGNDEEVNEADEGGDSAPAEGEGEEGQKEVEQAEKQQEEETVVPGATEPEPEPTKTTETGPAEAPAKEAEAEVELPPPPPPPSAPEENPSTPAAADKAAKKKRSKREEQLLQQNKLRAISTPNRNETILEKNVTFMDRSADLSAIPVLSPPSPKRAAADKEKERANNTEDLSFKFRRGRKDLFEEMVKKGDSKRASAVQSTSSSTRSSRKKVEEEAPEKKEKEKPPPEEEARSTRSQRASRQRKKT